MNYTSDAIDPFTRALGSPIIETQAFIAKYDAFELFCGGCTTSSRPWTIVISIVEHAILSRFIRASFGFLAPSLESCERLDCCHSSDQPSRCGATDLPCYQDVQTAVGLG